MIHDVGPLYLLAGRLVARAIPVLSFGELLEPDQAARVRIWARRVFLARPTETQYGDDNGPALTDPVAKLDAFVQWGERATIPMRDDPQVPGWHRLAALVVIAADGARGDQRPEQGWHRIEAALAEDLETSLVFASDALVLPTATKARLASDPVVRAVRVQGDDPFDARRGGAYVAQLLADHWEGGAS